MKKLLTAGFMLLSFTCMVHAADVTIGAIIPLSGASATQGDDQRRGMELALEKINASGGVLGQPLKIVTEDSAGRAATGLDAAKKLVTVNRVPLIVGEFSSGITIPIAEYILQQGLAHINVASSSGRLRNLPEGSFSVIGLDNVSGAFGADDVYALGARKVAIIAPNNAFGQGLSEAFEEKFKALGGNIVSKVLYTEGQTSYRREIQQLEAGEPDYFVYTAYGKEAATINRESFELDLNERKWYALYLAMCTADSDPQYVEGQIGMDLNYVGPNGADYQKAYQNKFKSDFTSTFNGFAYDGVMLAAAAINKAESTDPSAIKQAIAEIGKNYEGVTGSIAFDADGQRTEQPYLRLKIAGGKVAPNQ
jgi:branched-chain amino acid transport system substrate-binding protein